MPAETYVSYNGYQVVNVRDSGDKQDTNETKARKDNITIIPMTPSDAANVSMNDVYMNESVPDGKTKMILGNCGDFATMYVSLARSLGIPASIASAFDIEGIGPTSQPGGSQVVLGTHWLPMIWLDEPPLESLKNPPYPYNWYILDPQDNYNTTKYGIGDWPTMSIDPLIDYARSAISISYFGIDYLYISSTRWNPYIEKYSVDLVEDTNQDVHFELVNGTTTGDLGFGDIDFFLLNLTYLSHSDWAIVNLTWTDGICAQLLMNDTSDYPYYNGSWDEASQTRIFEGVDWTGTGRNITTPGVYYIIVDANMPDDANHSGKAQYGNYGTYDVSVTVY